MIGKIISGGQTGVERAALDVAMKLGIDHGGWIPKNSSRLHGLVDQKYRLKESVESGYQNAIEQNVKASNGTLLITRGQKTLETRQAVQMALKHKKQLLHVDLSQNSAFEGASLANAWFSLNAVQYAYVTGINADLDPDIYRQTLKILQTAFYLSFVKQDPPNKDQGFEVDLPREMSGSHPQKVPEAVALLKSVLPLKDRAVMANMQLDELDQLHSGLGEYIKQNFGLYKGNEPLLKSCAEAGNMPHPVLDDACAVILKALWEDLQMTHKLRVIK